MFFLVRSFPQEYIKLNVIKIFNYKVFRQLSSCCNVCLVSFMHMMLSPKTAMGRRGRGGKGNIKAPGGKLEAEVRGSFPSSPSTQASRGNQRQS